MILKKSFPRPTPSEIVYNPPTMRWLMLSLLFVATTINYLDRALLGMILPEIRKDLHFSDATYGTIQFWFQIAYGAGSLIGGKLLDKYGTRIGYGFAALIWSAAATMNSLARSAFQFGMLRTLLGLGEAPNFPACNKATAEWFPPSQRAFAMGVVNFGTNLANIIGPALFLWIALTWNWQTCFAAMGIVGFIWVPAFFLVYHVPKQTSGALLQIPKMSIKEVLKYKQSWGYAWAKFLTDPVWWFYLFWLPTYLTTVRHFTPEQRRDALTLVYAISGVGALAGGVASSYLMKLGWHVGKARKSTMLICAIVMPACGCAVLVQNNWLAVVLFGFATAAHQAWMTNLFTAPADVFPREAVGSANGFGVALGAWGGALLSGLIPGFVIPVIGYVPVMLSMSCLYLIAWGIVHKTLGDFSMVKLTEPSIKIPEPVPSQS